MISHYCRHTSLSGYHKDPCQPIICHFERTPSPLPAQFFIMTQRVFPECLGARPGPVLARCCLPLCAVDNTINPTSTQRLPLLANVDNVFSSLLLNTQTLTSVFIVIQFSHKNRHFSVAMFVLRNGQCPLSSPTMPVAISATPL